MVRFLLIGLLVIGWPVTVIADDSLDALLSRVAEAYGGTDLLIRTKAVIQTGTTYSTMRDSSGPVMRAYQHPDKLRIEIRYPGSDPETRTLMGPHGWRGGVPVKGPFHASMVLQATRMGLPYNLLEGRGRLRDRGAVTGESGKTLRAVELPLSEDMHLIVEIDPASGHILKTRGVLSMGGNRMEFITAYEAFRREEGRLYAAKEVHYAMGQRTGYTDIEQVEFRDRLSDSLFLPQP
jgi:hypothetical protein